MPSLSSNSNNLNVTIKTSADTTGVDKTSQSIKSLGNETDANAPKTNNFTKALDDSEASAGKLGATIGVVSGIVSSVFTKAISAVTDTIGSAVSRVDTLNNANRTFQNMGFTASDTASAVNTLKTSILGLPTSLNDAISGVELLAGAIGNIKTAQQVFTSVNDAVLGFGGTASDVSGAVTQLSQAISTGTIDAGTFNSLVQNGMGPALTALAKQMGLSSGQLKNDLSTGVISAQQFQDALIALDKNGGGGMVSLQKIAKDSTTGIGTGFDNAKTAITRGVADIITAIGSKGISTSIANIGTSFEGALKDISNVVNFVKANKDVFEALAVSIGTVTAAMLILQAVQIGSELITVFQVATMGAGALEQLTVSTKAATLAQIALDAAMNVNPITIIIIAIAALVAGLVFFFTQTKLGRQIFGDVMSFIGDVVKNAGKIIGDTTKSVGEDFNAVGNFIGSVGDEIATVWNNIVSFITTVIGAVVQSVETVFTDVVNFFKQWGLTILAIAFWPIALAVGLIIKYWQPITAFFKAIWSSIVVVFTPVVTFFATVFGAAWTVVASYWNGAIAFYVRIWNGIVAIFSTVAGFFASVFGTAWNAVVFAFGATVSFFSGVFGAVWNVITAIFTPIGNFFGTVFSQAWAAITSVFSAVGGFFQGVWNTIAGIFTPVGTAMGNAIGNAFKGVLNSVLKIAVDAINTVIGGIDTAVDIINKIPGVHITKINSLEIPQFATGVTNFGGGMAVVGENGPELVNLPAGSSVYTNNQSRNTINNMKSGANINVVQNINNQVDYDKGILQLGFMLRKA